LPITSMPSMSMVRGTAAPKTKIHEGRLSSGLQRAFRFSQASGAKLARSAELVDVPSNGLGGSGFFAMPAISAASGGHSVQVKGPTFLILKRSERWELSKQPQRGNVRALLRGKARDVIRKQHRSAASAGCGGAASPGGRKARFSRLETDVAIVSARLNLRAAAIHRL
jgi:hypothetical protein